MKVFNLCCDRDHRFEGWFASASAFEDQLAARQVACPLCDSTSVSRLPSAPRLRRHAAADSAPPEPVQLQQKILALVREIAARSEDVGERFAEEARRIHYEEIPERAIRGSASREECEALIDEGIAVLPLPALAKEPLQ